MSSFEIKVDLSAVQKLKGMASHLPRAVENGLEQGARVVLKEKQGEVKKTYDRPIPRRPKSGKPYWTRTGNFRRGQAIERPSNTERLVTTQGPASRYEGRLAHLPNSPIDGVNRSNPAAEEATRKIGPQLQRIVEQEIRDQFGI